MEKHKNNLSDLLSLKGENARLSFPWPVRYKKKKNRNPLGIREEYVTVWVIFSVFM